MLTSHSDVWSLWAACAVQATVLVVANSEAAVTLVRDAQPTATIVLGAEPTRAAQFAAFELQEHVRRITGATLTIVREGQPVGGECIWVGDSESTRAFGLPPEGFGPQEYAVQFVTGGVVLAGRDAPDTGQVVYDTDNLPACSGWPGFWEERGTLHAVYDFLETYCGVRWFNPTELGTVYPRSANLTVGGPDIRRRPAMEYRDAIGATGDNPRAYDAYVALWTSDAGEYRAWDAEAYRELHRRYPDGNQYEEARGKLAQLFLLRMRNGGQVARCNHSLYGYYARFWEPDPGHPELFVGRRPELFAQGYEGQPPQMCYSSQELVDQLAQDARDYYDGKATGRDQGIFWAPALPNPFPVEPMDNGLFCKCPRCQAVLAGSDDTPRFFSTGTHSDYFFSFVNAVARQLARTHPQGKIITLAYASHAEPPSFPLEPNVAVQFCFSSNRSPADRAQYEHELELLRRWARHGSGQPLYLWLYDTFPLETARNGKYHCFPGFFAHATGEQFRVFQECGVRGIFHCGYGQEVEAYVTFKLMDDPTRNVDALLEEYFTGLYGPAAEPMRALYEGIERTWCDPALRPAEPVSGPQLAWGHLGTGERMAGFQALLDQARALAQTEDQLRRIALFEHGVWSYMVAGRQQYLARASAPIPAISVPLTSRVDGDPAVVNWSAAASLPGPWYDRGGADPTPRRLSGRVVHDGEYLYLELTDECDTAKLVAAPGVFPYDDWEIFVAAQRALPYRQYAVSPDGLTCALSHGEVNWRMNVSVQDAGLRAVSDRSSPDRWVTRLSVPLRQVVPGGVQPGGRLYLNVIRVSGPQVAGTPGLAIDTWVSHCTVHEVDRLGELTLERP